MNTKQYFSWRRDFCMRETECVHFSSGQTIYRQIILTHICSVLIWFGCGLIDILIHCKSCCYQGFWYIASSSQLYAVHSMNNVIRWRFVIFLLWSGTSQIYRCSLRNCCEVNMGSCNVLAPSSNVYPDQCRNMPSLDRNSVIRQQFDPQCLTVIKILNLSVIFVRFVSMELKRLDHSVKSLLSDKMIQCHISKLIIVFLLAKIWFWQVCSLVVSVCLFVSLYGNFTKSQERLSQSSPNLVTNKH